MRATARLIGFVFATGATVFVIVSAAVAVQVSRVVVDLRSRSREHAHAARLVGVPTDRHDVFVVTADRPAAVMEFLKQFAQCCLGATGRAYSADDFCPALLQWVSRTGRLRLEKILAHGIVSGWGYCNG